ncbi:unnamed protein product [Timema podura]|uniref:Uncharacterized protein n=1 Tax=Timema podura TaxID=61482 RepID=A0ABN7PKL7_TIMPD|nr:unnamed protein product [Timema podura]
MLATLKLKWRIYPSQISHILSSSHNQTIVSH